MEIQNAPLTEEQMNRIQRLIVEMGNKMACVKATGIGYRMINSILEKRYGAPEDIKLLMDYCDAVENANTVEVK